MDFSARSTAVVLFLATVAATATAQPGRLSRPRGGIEIGMAAPSLLVRDASGPQLHLGFAPVIGGIAAWSLGPRLKSMLALRASAAVLRGSQGNAEWDAGRSSQIGLQFGLERSLGARFGVSLAGGPTFLFGPGDVTPFRAASSALHWGGSGGASWRVSQKRPIAATLAVDAFMIGGSSLNDPIAEPAWVRRVVVGVRYGG